MKLLITLSLLALSLSSFAATDEVMKRVHGIVSSFEQERGAGCISTHSSEIETPVLFFNTFEYECKALGGKVTKLKIGVRSNIWKKSDIETDTVAQETNRDY